MARRIRRITGVLFLLLNGLRAQVDLAGSQDEIIFYISANTRILEVRYGESFDDAGVIVKSLPLDFKTSGRSRAYPYEGPNPLVFFEENPAPTADDPAAMIQTPVAQLMMPAGVDEVLILFHANPDYPKVGLKYRLRAVDVSPDSIPARHISIFNGTHQKFLGAIGEEVQTADPGVLEVVPGINRPVPIHPKGTVKLAFEFKKEGWQRVYENSFECRSDERLLLVIFPPRFPGSADLRGKLIRFRAVKEEDGEARPW